MASATQLNPSTTLSTTAATSLSPAGAVVPGSNPFDQMLTLMASGNLRVEAESAKSMVAFNQFADEMRKNFAALVTENGKLKEAVIRLESHNKSSEALQTARIFSLQEQLDKSRYANNLMQEQIDRMKYAKLAEEYNASLEKLQNDAKKWTNTYIRVAQWFRANAGWAISVIDKRNAEISVNQRNLYHDELIKEITSQLKSDPCLSNKKITVKSPAFKTWATGCGALMLKILGLQPLHNS